MKPGLLRIQIVHAGTSMCVHINDGRLHRLEDFMGRTDDQMSNRWTAFVHARLSAQHILQEQHENHVLEAIW